MLHPVCVLCECRRDGRPDPGVDRPVVHGQAIHRCGKLNRSSLRITRVSIPSATADATLPATARAVLVGLLTLGLCLLARAVSGGQPLSLLLWPALGVAFAFGWRWGRLWTLPAALGALAYGLIVFDSPTPAVATAIGTALGAVASIEALRRFNAWNPAEYRLQPVLRFLAVALLIASPIFAVILGLGGVFHAIAPSDHALHVLLGTWLAGALGTVLVAPAGLAVIDEPSAPASEVRASHVRLDWAAFGLSGLVAIAHLALSSLGLQPYANMVLFLFFPIVVWSAVRCDEHSSAVTLLLSALPLLAAHAYQSPGQPLPSASVFESSVMVLCAVIVAQILQALASDRRGALDRIAQQARQDMTTGLLNDRGMLAEFSERLAAPGRPNLGLIGVTLTNFDAINDLCGPLAAMQLEQSAAALLLRQPGTQFAARLSSGRYAIVIESQTVAQVRNVARDVYAHLAGQMFAAEHGHLRLQVCVGGLLIDHQAQINSEDCMSSMADALAIAASVRDPQLFVEPLSQSMIDSRRSLQNKVEHLREAIREMRLELYAQPVIDPEAPEGFASYEVLTRLRDRDGSLLQPPEFLTLAVQSQMSVTFDRAVIKCAFEWLANHPSALARTHKCSINLSGATMSDGAIADYIRQQRTLCGIPAERIVFEITESEAIRNPSAASRLLDDLKSQGFGIALDDFGTGLATFEYLKRFPLDYVKIDGSFIRNLTNNPIDEEIVMSTVRVAARMNLRTVAEHVHNETVHTRLRELGVKYLQGDLFGRALPIRDIFDKLDAVQDARAAALAAQPVPAVPVAHLS